MSARHLVAAPCTADAGAQLHNCCSMACARSCKVAVLAIVRMPCAGGPPAHSTGHSSSAVAPVPRNVAASVSTRHRTLSTFGRYRGTAARPVNGCDTVERPGLPYSCADDGSFCGAVPAGFSGSQAAPPGSPTLRPRTPVRDGENGGAEGYYGMLYGHLCQTH